MNLFCACRRWGSTTAAAPATGGAAPRTNQQAYSRMQRAVHASRGRRSGVIVGTRPLVPASVVPEELINQVIIDIRAPKIGDIILKSPEMQIKCQIENSPNVVAVCM